MNKVFLWFVLSCKRTLKRPFFPILLLLFPAGLFLLHKAETKGSDKIAIALCTEGNEWNESVAEELINSGSSFAYYRCDSKEELEEEVMTGRAECGYLFSGGLLEKLNNKNYRRSVTVVTAPSTVVAKLASESVFAGIFRVYGFELLKQYAGNGEPFMELDPAFVIKELEPLFRGYLKNGKTFSFEYVTAEGEALKEDTVKAVLPVRGVVAVFIFVMGLSAAVTVGEDGKNGLLKIMSTNKKRLFTAAQLAAPVFLSCLASLLCLYVTGNGRGFGTELAVLFVYGVVVIMFAWFLLAIFKNPFILSGLIPFFIIISLIACPVFADLSVFVPILKGISYLLPPTYYLWM